MSSSFVKLLLISPQAAAVPGPDNTTANPLPRNGRLQSEELSSSVLTRLATIEALLGIGATAQNSNGLGNLPVDTPVDDADEDTSLNGLWHATTNLKRFTSPRHVKIWSHAIVKKLWVS